MKTTTFKNQQPGRSDFIRRLAEIDVETTRGTSPATLSSPLVMRNLAIYQNAVIDAAVTNARRPKHS